MANQILVNPFPSGFDSTQTLLTVRCTVALCGAAVTTGEPLNWASLTEGIGYNEINFDGNGIHGAGSALTTGFAVSVGVCTCTAANNFSVGQQVSFVGNTGTLSALFNGQVATIVSATSSQFTFATTNTGTTTSGDVGLAFNYSPVLVPVRPNGSTLAATVSALSASGGIITVTAANVYLPGAQVTISVATGTLGPKLTGTYTVLSSTTTAFTFASASTGSTGTGTASGINPPVPFSICFYSALNSGYLYQYSQSTGVLFVDGQTSGASAGDPLAKLAAAAYPAGVLADVIKYEAKFRKA